MGVVKLWWVQFVEGSKVKLQWFQGMWQTQLHYTNTLVLTCVLNCLIFGTGLRKVGTQGMSLSAIMKSYGFRYVVVEISCKLMR